MWPFNRLSLFWKIFLWFWLTTVVLMSVFVISWVVYRDAITFHPASQSMTAIIEKLAYVLQSDMSEHRQKRAIKNLLRAFEPPIKMIPPPGEPQSRQAKHRHYLPYYLLSDNSDNSSSQRIPEAIIALKNRAENELFVAVQGDYVFIGPHTVSVSGATQSLYISQFIGRSKGRMLLHVMHSIAWWQVLVFVIVSALLCALLAWSITRPIRRLQWVTNLLAQGKPISAAQQLNSRRDEFYQLAQDFDRMSNKIFETIDSQKQLLSDVSHELRSPLTRIQLSVGLLEQQLSSAQDKHLIRIEQECQRMDQMIGQLLDIAALERGQVFEQEQQFELNGLLNDLISDTAFEAKNREIELVFQRHPTKIIINGFYQLLYRALENILRNALRYAPPQSQVVIELTCDDNGINIAISDRGIGVEQSELEKIFHPFYRTDSARERDSGGAGLGLSIAYRAVLSHQGMIVAHNNPPQGLTVMVQIPLCRCNPNPVSQ